MPPTKAAKRKDASRITVVEPWKETEDEARWRSKLALLVQVKNRQSTVPGVVYDLKQQFPWLSRAVDASPEQRAEYEEVMLRLVQPRCVHFPMNKSHAGDNHFVGKTISHFLQSPWHAYLQAQWNGPLARSAYTPGILRALLFNVPTSRYRAVVARVALEVKLVKAAAAYSQDMPLDSPQTRRLFWIIVHLHAALAAKFDSAELSKWIGWESLASDQPALTGYVVKALKTTAARCGENFAMTLKAEKRIAEIDRKFEQFMITHPRDLYFNHDVLEISERCKLAREDKFLVCLRKGVTLPSQTVPTDPEDLFELKTPHSFAGHAMETIDDALRVLDLADFMVHHDHVRVDIAPPPPHPVDTAGQQPAAAIVNVPLPPSEDQGMDCEDIDSFMNGVADLYHQNGEGVNGNRCCSLDALLNEYDDFQSTEPTTLPTIARLEHMVKFEEVLAKDLRRVNELMAELRRSKEHTRECSLIADELVACAKELQQSVIETKALGAAEYQHEIDEVRAMVARFKEYAARELQIRVDRLGPEANLDRIQSALISIGDEIRAEICEQQKRVERAMRKKRRMQLRAEAKRISSEILGLAALANTVRAELFAEVHAELMGLRTELMVLILKARRLNADIKIIRDESQDLLDKHNLQTLKRSFVEAADFFLPPEMLENPVCRLCFKGISWDSQFRFVPRVEGFVCIDCILGCRVLPVDRLEREIVDRIKSVRKVFDSLEGPSPLGWPMNGATYVDMERAFRQAAPHFLTTGMYEDEVFCGMCLEPIQWDAQDPRTGFAVCCSGLGFMCGDCLGQPHAKHPTIAEYKIVGTVAEVRKRLEI